MAGDKIRVILFDSLLGSPRSISQFDTQKSTLYL